MMTIRQLWRFLHPYRRRAAVVLLLSLTDTALASIGVGIVLPVVQAILHPEHRSAIIGRFVPAFDTLSPNRRLLFLTLGTVAIFVVKALVALGAVMTSHGLLQRLRFYWVGRIGTYYLCGPFGRVAGRKQGELLNDWFNETLSATRFYLSSLTYISSLVLVFVLILLGLLADWRAMVALIGLGGLVALVVRKTLYGHSSTLSATKLQLNQAVTSTMVEDLANLRDVKLMRAEHTRLRHLAELSQRLGQIFRRSAVIAEVPRIAAELIAVTLMMTMVTVGALVMDLKPEALLPAMMFFSVASYRLVTAASQMMSARIKALNELQSLRRVQEVVSQADDREALDRGEAMSRIDTDIVLRDLDFGYAANSLVIQDVTVVIPRGKTTFLVGPSGAGKSTLLDLLLRLIEPSRGTIEANGRSASEFRLADWRRAFGYVSQDVSLFNGSLRMNLLLARPDATEAQLLEACRLAGADTFVRLLPDSLDTTVGDRGYRLSGGQRKRIAIARALIGNPSVLVLDEATTSFEHSLENEMLRNLKAALPELTVIQVTHRLQSITNADWVIQLDEGRVVACGEAVNQ